MHRGDSIAISTDGWDVIENALPMRCRDALVALDSRERSDLIDITLDVGRTVDARFISAEGEKYRKVLLEDLLTLEDLQQTVDNIGEFDSENRATMNGCLHRISCMRNRSQQVIGLTVRVGRTIKGLVPVIQDVLNEAVKDRKSVLLLGKPGTGKTSFLRELSSVLADRGER